MSTKPLKCPICKTARHVMVTEHGDYFEVFCDGCCAPYLNAEGPTEADAIDGWNEIVIDETNDFVQGQAQKYGEPYDG